MNFRATIYRLAYPFYEAYRDILRVDGVGSACVIERDRKILLVRNTYGDRKWTFPGGLVGRGEAMSEAAKREAAEEVGIAVRTVHDHGSFVHEKNHHRDAVYVFSADVASGAVVIDPGEI